MKSTVSAVIKRKDFKINKTEHVLNYDFDNIYPQRCEDIISDSPTGKTCLDIKTDFLIGEGFNDKIFYKTVVNNKGLTNDGLLRLIASDVAKFKSCALHFNFNGLGEIREINFIPWSNIRFVDPNEEDEAFAGKIAVYSDWERIKKKNISIKDIDFIEAYSGDKEAVLESVDRLTVYEKDGETVSVSGWEKYKGQIFIYTPNPGEYPLATFDSVLEEMLVEGRMKRFKLSSASNNFLASHILVTGEKESETEEEEFVEVLKNFSGADESGKILWLQKEDEADTIELQKVDIQNYDGAFRYTEESSEKQIMKIFRVPPVFLLSISGSLGANNQLKEAFAFYNAITKNERLIIEEIFAKVFENWHDQKVNPSNDYSIIILSAPEVSSKITQEYFPYYTKNEIRVANGDSEVQDIQAGQKLLVETLGVGGTQALTSILQDIVLTYEQKFGALKILFGLSEDEVKALLGEKPEANINIR